MVQFSFLWVFRCLITASGIISPQKALEVSFDYAGFPQQLMLTAQASLQYGAGESIPFLWMESQNRLVWRVTIPAMEIQLPSSQSRDNYGRCFLIYVDAITGILIEVASTWPANEAPMAALAEPLTAEQDMLGSGEERYASFVVAREGVTLIDALDAIHRRGHNPLIARQIIAHRVARTKMGKSDVHAVWAITLRGVPLIKKGKHISDHYQFRHLIDLGSGKYVGHTNVPLAKYREFKAEWRKNNSEAR